MLEFTDAQKSACDLSRNIAVTAGAGSGKTTVLVERYLWCLRQPATNYQVQRVVAITFTEKAAGEMLGRIRARVIERINLGLSETARWEDVLEHLPLAPIATIHGFCQRILREFAVEAGVDPNFDVLDETSQRLLFARLLDDVIQQRAAANDADLQALATLWATPGALRQVLLALLGAREKSLPWAQQLGQIDFATYSQQLTQLLTHLQRRGVQRLLADQVWPQLIAQMRALIPAGDTSKLTTRCLNVLEFDQEFRQQTDPAQQLLTIHMLERECRMITPSKAWKDEARNTRLAAIFEQLKALSNTYLPFADRLPEPLERSGFQLQQALARLLGQCFDRYADTKAARQLLDFDELQERVLALLQQPELQRLLARRYDYIMVDEFQDTNQVQWELIRRLAVTGKEFARNKLCIVGDEKQSIYMFRGADVAVFGDVRRTLQTVNAAHQVLPHVPLIPAHWSPPAAPAGESAGELSMAENFRSQPRLISFFNALFAHLFLPEVDPERPYDVRHQELIAALPPKSQPAPVELSPVEFLLLPVATESTDATALEEAEPLLVARRIRQLIAEHQPTEAGSRPTLNFRDIAILLRTRTRLKAFEEALRQLEIPYVVAGGIGFFQQQEIYDVVNLLRVLVDSRADVALAGALRSPILNFTDDQLLYATTAGQTLHPPDVAPLRAKTLWEKLQFHAQHTDLIPVELDPPKFSYVAALLRQWRTLADSLPLPHLLRRIFDETGLYGMLNDEQARPNLEKLLDRARRFEAQGLQAVPDFVAYLDQLIELEEREGEAQLATTGMDVVQIMTIHAAKGLEFPVVCVPELARPFNYGESDAVYLDALPAGIVESGGPAFAAGVKGLNPEKNYARENTFWREYLKSLNRAKTDAEMKRLLYVACTRAKNRLVLSGKLLDEADEGGRASWMGWLQNIFALTAALPQKGVTLTLATPPPDGDAELFIPLRTPADVTPPAAPASPVHAGPHALDMPALEADPALLALLQANLRPITGPANQIFQVSPSTLHRLLLCPRRFYWEEILQVKLLHFFEPLTQHDDAPASERLAEPRHFGAWRGRVMHKLFERQMFDADLSHAEADRLLTAVCAEFHIAPHIRRQMDLDAAFQRARQHYLTTGLFAALRAAPQVYREFPFACRLGQADITGVLDVLYFDSTAQVWTILDYKTNEIAVEQIEDEIRKHGYDIQMQVYALALRQILHVEEVRGILFFTFPGCRYEQIDLSSRALHQLETSLTSAWADFSQGLLQPAPHATECACCAYQPAGACQR